MSAEVFHRTGLSLLPGAGRSRTPAESLETLAKSRPPLCVPPFSHSMATSLQTLADDAAAQLAAIWDALGVEGAERGDYARLLHEDVAAVFRSRVETQAARRAAVAADIDALRTTIANMHHAMEQEEVVVRLTRLRVRSLR